MTPPPDTWTLESFFPEFNGPAHQSFMADLDRDLARELASASSLAPLETATASAWADHVLAWEDLGGRLEHVGAYLGCLGAADAANEAVQAATADLARRSADFGKLQSQLMRAFRPADEAGWQRLIKDPRLADAEHALQQLREQARFQMDVEAEALAADLSIDGLGAWSRLYDTLTGKMSFTLTRPDGRTETVPMSQRRALLTDPDRRVRAAAFAGGNAVWAAQEDVMAAALNAIAGTRHTLYARRGQPHYLDAPLHAAAVSRETIEAMFSAISANYEVPRRILKLSARLQGTPALAWYDLDTPQLPDTLPQLDWTRAVAMVDDAFGAAYPRLQAYFRASVEQRWIEAEKRPNKRAGAFATGSPLTREERIFMTFAGTMQDVTTLAHEVGHTWHSHLLGPLRPCARAYPMTLAETASTFAENMLAAGLIANPDLNEDQRDFLIEQRIAHAPAYLLNISARFHFESRFYEERRAGQVPVSRIRQLMVEAQREVYGDTLLVGGEDPWFWASKGHFYIGELSFYNYPYTFGFLLSAALYQHFEHEGPAFLERYETLLGLTGRATCEEVVRRSLGRDLRDPAFWQEAIRGLTPSIDAYAGVIAKRTGSTN